MKLKLLGNLFVSRNFFFFCLNHPISNNRIGPRLIRIRSVVTVKIFYSSQIVCLVGIEPENSSHLPSLRRQLSHNCLVVSRNFFDAADSFLHSCQDPNPSYSSVAAKACMLYKNDRTRKLLCTLNTGKFLPTKGTPFFPLICMYLFTYRFHCASP